MKTAFKSSEEARGTKMSKLFQLLLYLCTVGELHGQFEGSGYTEISYNEVIPENTWNTLQMHYRNPHWCHSLSLSNGEVNCFPPNGGRYRTTLGTHCLQSCHHGYRLVGRASVRCMENRRWSGSGHCRQIRCHVLPLIDHGTYICTNDVAVDSRCDYACNKGYELEGDRTRTCLEAGKWSGTEPVCIDNDPPTIKCPASRVRIAGPGRQTAKVSWEPPVVKDSTDATVKAVILTGQEPGSNFKEGIHTIRYKVYDRARNKAACKFIVRVEVRRCEVLKAPQHGYLTCSSDKNNYGAVCQYHCDGGYDRRGTRTRVCQFNRDWSMSAPVCVPMEINTDVRSVAALLDQFYEKRRLLIVSAPDSSNHYYKRQNLILQKAGCGLDLRQVTVIELIGLPPREVGRIKDRKLNSEVIEGLRQALRISRGYFSMVLLDEHGVDHERFISPATSEELYYIIEFNLMDEEERERLEKKRDYCE